jgi:acylphosphatase
MPYSAGKREMASPKRVRITVRGRVQGVGFRYAAVGEARRLALTGWARNQLDGSVEIVADGPTEAIDALLTWCRTGPSMARVREVVQEEMARDTPLREFDVRW